MSHPAGRTRTTPVDAATRIVSVDVLRGLVIALMIFVNDLASAANAPTWLKHVDSRFDGMTLPDVVFPAFLFIAGMSIPLSIGRSILQGRSRTSQMGKVIVRTLSLLAIGVVMVNGEAHSPWNRGLWMTLAYAAMLLAFAVVPTQPGRARNALLAGRWIGGISLAALVLLYRNANGQAMVLGPLVGGGAAWLNHSWWGILGLIGWAYFVAALAYLVVGHRREWLVGLAAMLMAMYITADSGVHERLAGRPWLDWARPALETAGSAAGWIGGHVGWGDMLGSLAGISVLGCCLGTILTPGSDAPTPAAKLRWAALFAVGLAFSGFLLDGPYGISKVRATPAWCLYCSAITTAVWMLVYWMTDLLGWRGWTWLVAPAGANPLLAYLLHPLLVGMVVLGGSWLARTVFFYHALPSPACVVGSAVMAVVVVQFTGWLERRGLRLKV